MTERKSRRLAEKQETLISKSTDRQPHVSKSPSRTRNTESIERRGTRARRTTSKVVLSETDDETDLEDDYESEEEIKKPKKRARQITKQPSKRNAPVKQKPAIPPGRTIQRVNRSSTVDPLRQVSHHNKTNNLTAYALARERLHVSAVPESLPCREEEFMTIAGYIEGAIQDSTGTCVYISGVPGTGKTATVHEVIRHLQQQAAEKKLPGFDFAEINGMKLTDPNQAYSILWECMDRAADTEKKKRYTAAHALQLLEAKFSKPNNNQRITVVLMDELDLLVTKKQTVMYNFFDWPSRPHSKLIVVAIANTMDLPERLMSNKIASRMGLTRINFQPYRHDQLYQIVQSRLQGIDAFTKEAVEFAARKVSAVSGDARRALDICRRAVEIVEQKSTMNNNTSKELQVTIAIIDQAIKEMFTSPAVAFIRSCSLHQKIFLVACMQRVRVSGLAEIEFGDVAQYHTQTCKWHNIEPINTSDLMRVCESLGQCRAIIMDSGRHDICMRISLNLMEEDIIMACKADKLISKLLDNLPKAHM